MLFTLHPMLSHAALSGWRQVPVEHATGYSSPQVLGSTHAVENVELSLAWKILCLRCSSSRIRAALQLAGSAPSAGCWASLARVVRDLASIAEIRIQQGALVP